MTLETAPAVSPPRTRSWYRDVALFGVALILFFPIILAVGLTIGEEYDALIFPAIIAVVALAVGAVLLLLGRWWPIIGVIGGLAAAGSSLEFSLSASSTLTASSTSRQRSSPWSAASSSSSAAR
jgi:hypothetical protein